LVTVLALFALIIPINLLFFQNINNLKYVGVACCQLYAGFFLGLLFDREG
jgi:hypothetical protein